jgi:hypothetical protein
MEDQVWFKAFLKTSMWNMGVSFAISSMQTGISYTSLIYEVQDLFFFNNSCFILRTINRRWGVA